VEGNRSCGELIGLAVSFRKLNGRGWGVGGKMCERGRRYCSDKGGLKLPQRKKTGRRTKGERLRSKRGERSEFKEEKGG